MFLTTLFHGYLEFFFLSNGYLEFLNFIILEDYCLVGHLDQYFKFIEFFFHFF